MPPSSTAGAAALLVRRGDGYVLNAPRAIPGWEARRFRRPAILVEGSHFYITAVRKSGRAAEYALSPWPAEGFDEPITEITLDAAFFRSLEEAPRAEIKARSSEGIQRLLKPFIGFLWSEMKQRMHDRGGVHPTEATRLSVFVEVLIFLTTSVLLGISKIAAIEGVMWSGPPWILVIVVGIDAIARYDRILGDEFSPPGFYEWLIRRRRK